MASAPIDWPAYSGLHPDGINADGSWRLLVGGAWRDSAGGGRIEVRNPADGRLVAVTAEAGADEVDAAVTAAGRSFDAGEWRLASAQARASALLRLADLIRANAEDFAVVEALNNGMILREARAMVKRCATIVEYASGFPQRAYGQQIPVADRYIDFTMREPVGVCALIVPWNGPLISALFKLAPAIALGNSVVLKPSELTPLTALKLGELIEAAGIPAGVVNIVAGGPETGRHLVEHPGVHKIAFTGSTATGKSIMAAAAQHVKRVTLELGGKAPNIVFDDFDVDDAVSGAISAVMRNCGQVCIAGARMLVQRRRHDEFVEKAIAAAARLRVGNGLAKDSQIGPIVSQRQLDRVQQFVTSAREDGAEVHGGAPLADGPLALGHFMAPAIVTGASNRQRINQEEIFGPVGAVIPFDDEDEAVAIANDTPYGLAAGVWTRDIKRALRVVRRVRAGTVWVNTYGWNFTEAPMGGFKESGLGRENGDAVIAAYTEIKNVVIDTDEKDSLDSFRLRSGR